MIDYNKLWSKKILHSLNPSNLIEIRYIKKWYHKLLGLKGRKVYISKCNNLEFIGKDKLDV